MNIKHTLSEKVTEYLLNNEGKAKISSLEIIKDDVFISLLGNNTHGNQYIPDAINKGARYIITDRKLENNFIFNKILVVDDFAFSRQVVINTLEQLGFNNTDEAADGYSALVRLKSALFEFVIMDWNMSKISGLELLKQIRADPKLKHIPVLMVTKDCLQEEIVAASKAGVNDYIIKPFEANTFAEKLENIFR